MSAPDSIATVRTRIGLQIAQIEERATKMKPADVCARMAAIRVAAAEHGLVALEGLADYGAHHALLPGHREATRNCIGHMAEALHSDRDEDRESILAAIALRLH